MTDILHQRFETSIRAFVNDLTAMVQAAALESVRAALDPGKLSAKRAAAKPSTKGLRPTIGVQRAVRDSYVTEDALAAVVSTDGDNLSRRRVAAVSPTAQVRAKPTKKSKSAPPRKPKPARKARNVRARTPKTVIVPTQRAPKPEATGPVEQAQIAQPLAAPV